MKKLFYLIALVAFTLTSCDKNEVDFNDNVVSENNTGLLIKKVRKLENPYSVSNMKKAYSALQQDGLMKASINIEATHLYVRFLPKDSIESELLMRDTTLTLFSYPLDYELTEGEKYIDSTLIGNDFTWLYTRVPVGFISPISKYEVLDELYMPMIADENSDTNQQNISQMRIKSEVIDYWTLLEEKSLKLTGNYQEKQTTQSGMRKAKKYTPQATIKVFDDLLKTYIPVAGIEVRARWWFNWESGITNSAGVAVMSGTFTGNYNWSIEWVSSLWSIRDGSIFTAYYNGPKGNQSNWAFNIDGGKSKAYGHVQRACYNMFFGDNLGAYKLPSTIVTGTGTIFPITISVHESNGRGKAGIFRGGNWLSFIPQISIWMNGDIERIYTDKDGNDSIVLEERYLQSNEIFSTTTHELAHATHVLNRDVDIASFIFINNFIIESWAETVEWSITKNEYKKLGSLYHFRNLQKQSWGLLKSDYSKNFSSTSMEYSPIFIDLMDSGNQQYYELYYPDYEFPDDDVSGFTMSELKGVLRKTFNIADLKKNVKALRSDATELANIDKLFETYEKAK